MWLHVSGRLAGQVAQQPRLLTLFISALGEVPAMVPMPFPELLNFCTKGSARATLGALPLFRPEGTPLVRLPSLAAAAALFAVLAFPAASSAALIDDGYFSDASGNGVDDDYSAFHGSFPRAEEIKNWTSGGHQYFRITINATHDGDNGMSSKWFGTGGGWNYTMRAKVKTTDFRTPFRARLTVHWKDVNGNYIRIGECNRSANWSDTSFHTLEDTGCRAPSNAVKMNLSIRANNGGCDPCADGEGYGTVGVDHLYLARTS
jgi:hypothetical protein